MKLPNINLKREHGILTALFIALVVQVFNTASLYHTISNLQEGLRLIADCFIGVSLEFGIFICIYNGYRPAGAWFALGSFLVGILFHDNWNGSVVDISIDPFSIKQIYFPKEFLSSTLLQGMNSLLVWFFSEIYVATKGIKENIKIVAEIEQTIADSKQELTDLHQQVTTKKQELTEIKKTLSSLKNECEIVKTKTEEVLKEKEGYEQEIITLQKRKAGVMRHIAE